MTTSSESADLAALCRLPRKALYAHAERFYRHGGGTEPDVAVIAYGAARAVLKDYGAAPGWFARWLGPLLIRREADALEQLSGLAGVPRLYARPDRHAVLMECVPARPWSQVRPADAAYARLDELVTAMHARGVAHCDLRSPSNILVDEQGRPFLVDFVARVRRGAAWNRPWHWVFGQFCRADRNALAKLKVRYAPHLAGAAEIARAEHRGGFDRFARALGAGIRAVARRFVRR